MASTRKRSTPVASVRTKTCAPSVRTPTRSTSSSKVRVLSTYKCCARDQICKQQRKREREREHLFKNDQCEASLNNNIYLVEREREKERERENIYLKTINARLV